MKSIETHVRKFLPLNISAISSVACEADFTVTELVTAAACGATATALTTYAYAPVVGLTPSCAPRLVHPHARHQTQTAFRLG